MNPLRWIKSLSEIPWQHRRKFKIFSRLLHCSSILAMDFSIFMVLYCLLFLLATLLPVDLELVMGPFGAIGVGAPGGFADDESGPSSREASPSSPSVVHPLALCLPVSVIVLRERRRKDAGVSRQQLQKCKLELDKTPCGSFKTDGRHGKEIDPTK